MKKRNRTPMTLSAALLALALVGTACSNDDNADPTPSPSASSTASASPSPSSAEATESASPADAPETISGTGEYVGLQDSHSIEIATEEGSTGFQVSPEIAEKVDSWEENTPVKFQYIVEKLDTDGGQVEQKTIVAIDKQ